MRRNVLLALLIGALLVPLSASAESGFATTRVHLRAGPGTGYPVLAVLPSGAPVHIIGCLSGYSWCDVTWGATRGWVAAYYLRTGSYGRSVFQRQGPPVTSFDFNNYWTSHYRDRPFYRDRGRWRPVTGLPEPTPAPRRSAHPPCQPGTPGCPQRFK